MQWQKHRLCCKSPCRLDTACVSCGHSDLSSGVSWWNMQRLLVCPLYPTHVSVSWLEEKPMTATSCMLWADWLGAGPVSVKQQWTSHHHQMSVLGLVHHRFRSGAEIDSALSPRLDLNLNAGNNCWIQTRLILDDTTTQQPPEPSCKHDLPALNDFDCILLVRSHTEFG